MELWEEFVVFRAVTFRPDEARGGRRRLRQQLNEFAKVWSATASGLEQASAAHSGLSGAAKALVAAVEELGGAVDADSRATSIGLADERIPLAKWEAVLAKVRGAAEQCAHEVARLDRSEYRSLISRTGDLAELAEQAHYALYDDGGAASGSDRVDSVSIVPALNRAALEKKRDSAEDARRGTNHALVLAKPWLSLDTVLMGSGDLLRDYPQEPLGEVRSAFADLKTVFLAREDPRRPQRFSTAMDRFLAAVRGLGEAIEPERQRLPIREKDEPLMAATAYPPAGAMDREVHYNRLDPFAWTWQLCLGGVALFALGFGFLRKPTFWLGIASVAAGLGFTAYGLAMRVSITRLAPVTNMFETVVYVSLIVAILGLWFNLLPLFDRGLRHAWRMTAAPIPWEAGPLGQERLALFPAETWRAANWRFCCRGFSSPGLPSSTWPTLRRFTPMGISRSRPADRPRSAIGPLGLSAFACWCS